MKRNWMVFTLTAAFVWAVWGWSHASDIKEAVGNKDRKEKATDAQLKGVATPPYVHTVVFYLKPNAPKDEVESIIADAHRLLAKIPSVKGLWIGRPADKGTAELAISDFHVSWVLLFDDYAGLQQYLEHKLHLEFREKHKKHAERVLIYDFVNQTR